HEPLAARYLCRTASAAFTDSALPASDCRVGRPQSHIPEGWSCRTARLANRLGQDVRGSPLALGPPHLHGRARALARAPKRSAPPSRAHIPHTRRRGTSAGCPPLLDDLFIRRGLDASTAGARCRA